MNQPSTTPSAPDIVDATGTCVLLVEDDRSVRRYLEVTLERWGYLVITASDGLEAMKLALARNVDVVITDAVMPHMSGQQLARFIRSNPKLAHVLIVLLTGQENKATDPTTEDLVDGYLYKPVKAEDLKTCLTTLLQR